MGVGSGVVGIGVGGGEVGFVATTGDVVGFTVDIVAGTGVDDV